MEKSISLEQVTTTNAIFEPVPTTFYALEGQFHSFDMKCNSVANKISRTRNGAEAPSRYEVSSGFVNGTKVPRL